jgi:CheY-like chemotaxis protein
MPARRPIRVLIVDDQPDVRLAFAYMLAYYGCEIREAADGYLALDLLAKERVDVVLTDLYMPGLDGVEFIRIIRRSPPPQPRIIAMSGSENVGHEVTMEAAGVVGADAVLPKPISRDQLINTIRRLLGDEFSSKLGA